jgi:hypothetical protein
MIIVASAGTTTINIGKKTDNEDQLTATFSRPLKTKTVITFKTPQQHKKAEIEKRRAIQNRTCWMVCTDVAPQQGETIDDCYFDFKYTYLAPHLAADSAKFAQFHDKMEQSRMLIDPDFWRLIAGRAYTSHDASVKQYAKAMDDFMHKLAQDGLNYRHPEDFKNMLREEFYKDLIK